MKKKIIEDDWIKLNEVFIQQTQSTRSSFQSRTRGFPLKFVTIFLTAALHPEAAALDNLFPVSFHLSDIGKELAVYFYDS